MREHLRIGIVGGSVGGSAAAALLSQLQHDVTVFERSSAELKARGAGLILRDEQIACLKELDLFDRDAMGVKPRERIWRVKDGATRLGRVIGRTPMGGEYWNYGQILGNLRKRLDASSYVLDAQVVRLAVGRDATSVELGDGTKGSFDLVIGADGYRSLVRSFVAPSSMPSFAGYAAWRGVLDERAFPDVAPVDPDLQTVGIEKGHAAFYLVPRADGGLATGERRINWLIYEGATEPGVIEIKRDATGYIDAEGVPPGAMSERQLSYLYDLTDRELPRWFRDVVRATPEPYMQPIFDLALSTYVDVEKRVCLLGDASAITRPHTGSGAGKAIDDALELARACESQADVEKALICYDEERVSAGRQLVELGRLLGVEQVTQAPEWAGMDAVEFARWSDGVTRQAWYAKEKLATQWEDTR